VDGKSIKVTDTSAIADTGTTLLLAPQQVADAVNAAIGAGAYDSNAGIYPIPCNMVTSGPPVTFKLGTVSIVMTAKEYVLQNPDGTCASGIASIGALGNGGPAYIFGDTFLRAAYTVFDVAGARLGFAQAQHPGGKVPVPVVSQATASAPSRITITKRKTRNVTATTVDTRSSGVPTAKTTEDPFPPMPSGSEVPFPPMPTDDPFPPMPTGTGDPFPPMPTSTEDPLPPMPTGSDDSFPSMPTGTEDPFPFPDTTDTGDSPFPSFKLRR
ncbi:aspartic peptidase domain-containing protein, partial [Chytriomyces sp. MP71]